MKKVIRTFFFYTIAIYLAGLIIPGFQIVSDWRGLIISGVILALLFLIVDPLFRFLLLPINLLTLGIFSFLSQILTFYVFLIIRPENFAIKAWQFTGWQFNPLGINIGSFTVNPFFTIILTALLISFIVSTLATLI